MAQRNPREKKRFSQENPLIITLDIIGFSRGAAAARDFANQVINRKNNNYYNKTLFGFGANESRYNCVGIKIRFMGLFDTVLSTAAGDFNLAVSDTQIGYVAHAVAVNEYRAVFPLESIESSYDNRGFGNYRIERGFIGAHSDVGGGYAGAGGDGGDLSDVALNWMWQQAAAAGVPMRALGADQVRVASPILHDESRVAPWVLPGLGGFSSDRDVRYPNQARPSKTTEPGEGMTYAQSQSGGYIQYHPYHAGNRAGMVDMKQYGQWLQSQGISIQ